MLKLAVKLRRSLALPAARCLCVVLLEHGPLLLLLEGVAELVVAVLVLLMARAFEGGAHLIYLVQFELIIGVFLL